MLDYFKRLKAFQIIAAIVIVGLLYGAINLYTKIQFYKSFANQTRITSVAAEEVQIDSINKIYPATSVIEAKTSYNVVSKTDGILNEIFFKESSFVEKGDKLFSILSTSSIGEILITAPFNGYVGLTDYKIGDKLNDPLFIGKRRLRLFWRFLEIINLKKSYRHNDNTNDSFLINPDND